MLIRVDSKLISQHFELDENDKCFFLREYTPNKGFQGSDTNDDILNFKKCPSLRDQEQYRYKLKAISKFANYISEEFKEYQVALNSFSWIPIPSSKSRDDPKYDDRLVQMLRQVKHLEHKNIVELLYTQQSHTPSHIGSERHSKEFLKTVFAVDQSQIANCKDNIILMDDVLTNGTHFKVCCDLIHEVKPNSMIRGLFLARRKII